MEKTQIKRMVIAIAISVVLSILVGQILSIFVTPEMTIRKEEAYSIKDTTYDSRIVIYSAYTGSKIVSIEGKNSVSVLEKNNNTYLKVVSKIAEDKYKYTMILLSPGISFVIESIIRDEDDEEFYYEYKEYDPLEDESGFDFKIKF